MEYYKFVYVVLVYKSSEDLLSFLKEVSCRTIKVVVVDSYCDEASSSIIQSICMSFSCDYLCVPNRGYGAGNNAGIKYVLDNYDFEWVVVSNPDIENIVIDYTAFGKGYGDCIVGPDVFNGNGHRQNPFIVRRIYVLDLLKYYGFKIKFRSFVNLSIFIYAIIKYIYRFILRFSSSLNGTVYSVHGSFFLISKGALLKLIPLFDDGMFLFCEEDYLARKAARERIPVLYDCSISVVHKEDGSVGKGNLDIFGHERDSYMRFFMSAKGGK